MCCRIRQLLKHDMKGCLKLGVPIVYICWILFEKKLKNFMVRLNHSQVKGWAERLETFKLVKISLDKCLSRLALLLQQSDG